MPDPIQGLAGSGPAGIATSGPAGTAPATGGTTQAEPATPVDQADVGGTETLLTTIAQAASQVPTVDEARVAALRQAIAAGTFQVDPQKTAEKLMQVEGNLAAGGGGS